ncbi:MAG: 2'-5' RNA ligase, partial [Gammaproteobacteria bacterium]
KFELTLVPELYRGIFDEDAIKSLWSQDPWGTVEGYVVRLADSFHRDEFHQSIAKFVRKGHVQTDEHWLRSGGELNMLRL